MSSRDSKKDTRIYIGNLPQDVRTRDIEDLFAKYGQISFIDVKTGSGRRQAYAFVEYEDPRDADDAVKYRDGYDFDGYRIRVEFTRGVGPRGPGGRPVFGKDDRDGSFRGGRRGGKKGGYRVRVSGLPPSGSWQDLKDHMREAGDVCYADVYKGTGTGVVEYIRYDDMKYALKKLDDTKFKSHEGETSYIKVEEDDDRSPPRGGGRGSRYSRSRSRSPRRPARGSPEYSPRGGGSRSRSRSRSPY